MFVKTEFYLFSEIFFEEKKTKQFLFCFFWFFGENFSKFELITRGHLWRNCQVGFQMNHLGKKFGIIFFLLWWWAEKNWTFGTKKTAGLIKLHSTSTQEQFEERSWHVLDFFGARMDFFTNSGQKLGANLSELHFRWPEEPNAQNKCFWEG